MSEAPAHLYLPRELVEQMAEKRAQEIASRQRQEPPPIVYRSNAVAVGGLGRQPTPQSLLAETLGWAAIAANAKANRVQGLEPIIEQRVRAPEGGIEWIEAVEHPGQQLIENPGPIFTKVILLRLTSYHLDQTGVAYWQILRDGLGVPRELWPLPVQSVQPVGSADRVIAGYEVRGQMGGRTVLPVEDVVRFWLPEPESPLSPMGSLGPQRVEWDADRFRIETIRTHFADGATPRTALKATPEAPSPSPDTKEAFWADWVGRYHMREGTNRAAPAFIPPGFDVVMLDQFGGLEKTMEWGSRVGEQILAAYGVPGSKVGMVADVNRAAAETNDYTMDKNAIEPMTIVIEDAATMQWVRPSYGADFRYGFRPFIPQDKEFRLRQEAQDLTLKIRLVNEIRRERPGLEPVDYGDEAIGTIADEPYRPDAEPGPEDERDLRSGSPRRLVVEYTTPSGAHRDVIEQDERDLRAAHPLLELDPLSGPVRQLPEPSAEARAQWDFNIRQEQRFVPKLQRALASVWEMQRREVLKRLRALMSRVVGDSLPTASRNERVGGTPTADQLFDPAALEWRVLYQERVTPTTVAVSAEAARRAVESLVEGGEFSLSNVLRELLEQEATVWQFTVDATTQGRIARALSQGATAGEGVEDIARRLNVVFRNRKRARTVARTEIGKANQFGQVIGYQSSGRVTHKQWNTSLDARVRDSHQIDGQQARLEETFTLGSGVQAQHPLDPALPAGELVNCRCFMTPVRAPETPA